MRSAFFFTILLHASLESCSQNAANLQEPGRLAGGTVIKERGVQPYWIDEFLFEGDPYITEAVRRSLPGRGGPGIVQPVKEKDGMLVAERDIILGHNVPGY